MRPNFIVIGAMKSGTTSLWKYLDAHPQIFLSYPKEPGFFVKELTWNQGWDWYESLFADAGDATAVGEASTHYTKWPEHQGVAELIHQHLPKAKLIYIMREPVERAISHYWHRVHYDHETRSPLAAFKADSRYIDFSRYAHQLRLYLEHFSREQLYVTSFERMTSSPTKVFPEIFSFLEVDASFNFTATDVAHNAGPAKVRSTRKWLHTIRWSKWWTRVAPLVPKSIKEFGKQHEFATIVRNNKCDQQIRDYLQPIYQEENERLFDLLGDRFHEWDQSRRAVQPEQVSVPS